ncbi:biotin--[acetyl-CoA-carboxylase] ligase [Arcobacter sp. FWKO B]|uniref:biotin--[acetyl-CoA-carboxylase] ligase n=1 Tax=Arcobacter sp. FWKO B TaxID=2593672 RepID=UPI0018A5B216|nr:biotin--[acetyl-CoA-carboxylase] ligase [Arcobacter sp. FWKO B]QOG11769.1 biotin--[acetyl-CoA-carboxylase] ligase [Arcobacter sp. FWKO B]
MEIIYLEEVDSTQLYLKELISKNSLYQDIAVVSLNQTKGIGSRNNFWSSTKGNLSFSFTKSTSNLPSDLKLQSASIYFSFLLKELFSNKGSQIWLKWPNDFYIGTKKIGGTITNLVDDVLVCGIGINIEEISDEYGVLDIKIDILETLNEYFSILENKIPWKEIFSLYKIEYELSKNFQVTLKNRKISLRDSILCEDGSIVLENEKVYSLR